MRRSRRQRATEEPEDLITGQNLFLPVSKMIFTPLIAKYMYAVQHGLTSAASHFSRKFGMNVSRTTVNSIRSAYVSEIIFVLCNIRTSLRCTKITCTKISNTNYFWSENFPNYGINILQGYSLTSNTLLWEFWFFNRQSFLQLKDM